MKISEIALVRNLMFRGFKSAFALFPVKGNIDQCLHQCLDETVVPYANAATKFLCGEGSSNHRSGCDENVDELVQPPIKETRLGGGHLPFSSNVTVAGFPMLIKEEKY